MKKLVALLVLGALALSACGPGSLTAATVNGAVITVDAVEELMVGGSVLNKEVFSQFVQTAVLLEILIDAAENDYGIAPTDEEVAAEADDIYSSNAVEGETLEEFLDQRGISEKRLNVDAHFGLIVRAVRIQLETSVQPTQENIEEAARLVEWSLAEVCAAHILLATEAEALDVLDRLDLGENFGELARELSVDTGSGANGGDLGCSSPDRYVLDFGEAAMSAEVGIPTDPVMSDFGYHLILVSERTEADPAQIPTESEISAELMSSLVNDAVSDWYFGAILGAVVVVEEDYGTWDAGPPPRVDPPA